MPTLWGKQYTRDELMQRIGRLEQVAGVRLVDRGDGTERGVRVLEFRTGAGFSFDILVDRAMDVGRCEHDGRALAKELDLLVYGHSHVGALERMPGGGVFANAGSWLDAPTFLRLTSGAVELLEWDGSPEGKRLHSVNLRA